jgi:hypothetical protein
MMDRVVIYLHFSVSHVCDAYTSSGASVPGRTAALVVAVAFWGA